MAEPARHLLEVEDLAVEFHTSHGIVRAVDGVGFHLDRGETLAILGESGSGKSVTAAAVMGLIDSPPGFVTRGRIRYRGRDLLTMPAAQRRLVNGKAIATIFQDPLAHLNPVYPIGWQIAETLRAHGVGPGPARARALELLTRVGIPEPARRIADYPHQLSGGQRQRVMIAMALALKPDILIADEPTTALDVTIQAQILTLLAELRAETGMGLLLITHDLGVVAEVADRVAVMHRGAVVETGPVREVLTRPRHGYTRRLLAAVPGRAAAASMAAPRDAAPPLLRVEDLTRHYPITSALLRRPTGGVVRALDGVGFELRTGEILAVVGESGSGKSTLARLLVRLDLATRGRAIFKGVDLLALTPRELAPLRRRIQMVFQDPAASLNPRMTIEAIVGEGLVIHPALVRPEHRRARVAALLERVGIGADQLRRYPHQFSGGQRQRIAIARALALEPDILVCDEAVSALDVSIQAQVIELLRELRRELDLAFLFIAHDLGLVRDFADRVLVMHAGRIVEAGSTARIFERPEHPYTRALLAATPTLDALGAPAPS